LPNQRIAGKAFEYACLNAFYCTLVHRQEIVIESTASYIYAEKSYNSLSPVIRNNLIHAAAAAVKVITRLEPLLEYPESDSPLFLKIQEDACGQIGDVRDILAMRRLNDWEIGLSVKHNHTAVKHSRLSAKIDFGSKWLGMPATSEYFDSITPIFEELNNLRSAKVKWNQLQNKSSKYYYPILRAFADELQKLDLLYPVVIPKNLLSYLLGKNDFYKVISHDDSKMTQIQAFSLYGTLNKPSGSIRPQIMLPKLHLPKKFYSIEFCNPSNNTIRVVCDEGWSLSFRIHNASTEVEPSLKFDITLLSVPPKLYNHFEPW
jgi:hypothetical protein